MSFKHKFCWLDEPDLRIEKQYTLQKYLLSIIDLDRFSHIVRYRLDMTWHFCVPQININAFNVSRHIYSTYIEGHEYVPYEPCTFNDQFYICSPALISRMYSAIFDSTQSSLYDLHKNSALRFSFRHPSHSLKGIEGLLYEVVNYLGYTVKCFPGLYQLHLKTHLTSHLLYVLNFLLSHSRLFFFRDSPSRFNVGYLLLLVYWKFSVNIKTARQKS